MHVDRCETRMLHHLYGSGKASIQAVMARYLYKPDQGLTLKASRGDRREEKEKGEVILKD